MSGNDSDRKPPPASDEERGVHVSRDAPGAEASAGRRRSKLAFHVQAERRAKGDDPVFDNIESRRPPPEAAAPSEEVASAESIDDEAAPNQAVGAEAPKEIGAEAPEAPKETENAPGSALGRVKRFFFRGGTDRST